LGSAFVREPADVGPHIKVVVEALRFDERSVNDLQFDLWVSD
jgi:hypothetical protein